eukprot:4076283-Alexandrium_andersonii.AAC.1
MSKSRVSIPRLGKFPKPPAHSWAAEQEHLRLTRQTMDVTERVQRLEDNMREEQVDKAVRQLL